MNANMAIIVKGGAVQEVVADTPVKVTIIDQDTEGADGDNLSEVEGLNGKAYVADMSPEINPEFMKQFTGSEVAEPGLTRDDTDGSDYTMPEEMQSCWITVGKLSVYVVRKGDGVMVEAYQTGSEADDSVASFEAYPEEVAA